MKLVRCRFELKWADLWIGVFSRTTTHSTTDRGGETMATDVWVCLLPCLPLHLTFLHEVAIPFVPEEAADAGTVA